MNESKREFLKKAYIAPVILITMAVTPTFASSGSGQTEVREKGNNGVGNGEDPQRNAGFPVCALTLRHLRAIRESTTVQEPGRVILGIRSDQFALRSCAGRVGRGYDHRKAKRESALPM